jgi:hypothetical protein
MLYDVTAQGFLIGKPIPADFWVKPLYSLFLSLLHLVAGQNFSLVVLLQVAVLALIPSLVYLLTRIIGNHLSGIVAASLVILREHNSIELSNIIQVSHVQLLLSDVFTMGGMVLLVLFMLWWLANPFTRRAIPIAVGGIIGLLILSRGHPILIIPFLFLIGFCFLRRHAQLMRESLSKMTTGLLLVMIPWLWHTYDLTGRIALQDDSSTFATKDAFVQSYAVSPDTNSESYGQFESEVFRQAIDHPLSIAQFVSAHYFHNVIYGYIFLPESFQIEKLESYVKRLPFWRSWKGSLSTEAWLLLFINLSVLALGFGSAWKKTKGLAFVPLAIGAAYNLSVAVTRRSGWRFIQPADWVTLVFYAIGITQMIVIVWSIFKGSVDEQVDRSVRPGGPAASNWIERSSVVISLPFLVIALTLILGHKVFSVFHPTSDADQVAQQYWNAAPGAESVNISSVEQFVQQKSAVIAYGKALYPVYMGANRGALNYSWLSFSKKPFDRLVFYLVGTQSAGVVLPLDNVPALFPDGANVVVVGCSDRDGNINALAVLLPRDPPILYTRQPLPDLTCPLPPPK